MVKVFNNSRTAVALLVVNRIPKLPSFSIQSIIDNSDIPIFIGYVNIADLDNLPKNPRITFVDLSDSLEHIDISQVNRDYQDFSTDTFFSLVQLKWVLFNKILITYRFDFLIYSDTDVIWTKPFVEIIENAFNSNSKLEILIQNFSYIPGDPQLCMGFVVFRNGPYCHQIIENGANLHRKLLNVNPRTGDDDVMTSLYKSLNFPSEIQLLPQSTFPVGNQLNLFIKRTIFPGLVPFSPFIFHANFVVGTKKKLLLLEKFISMQEIKSPEFNLVSRIGFEVRFFLFSLYHFLRYSLIKRFFKK